MKKFKMIFLTITIVIIAFSLAGCVGKEPNEIAYAVAIGIDSAENNNYKITIQYANPTQISGSSDSGAAAGSDIVENMVVEAPNIYAAVGLANQIDSKTFSLSHAKLIVFSEDVAEKGLKSITETFIRSEELRPDVYLAVSLGEASEYLMSVKPVMEVNPAKYYQLIYDKNNIVGVAEGIAKNFFFGLETGDYDSLLPVSGVIGEEDDGNFEDSSKSEPQENDSGNSENKSEGEEDDKSPQINEKQSQALVNENKFEYKMRNYIAGESAVELEKKSEAMGSAIFDGDKMIGIMGSVQTEIYKILSYDYHNSYLTLYNEQTPENPVTIKVSQEKSPQYDIDTDNKEINIKIFLEGDIYSLPSNYNIEKDIKNFEKNAQEYIGEACETFMTDFLEKYDSDIFHLNEKCKKKFLTNEEYNNFKSNVNYSEYKISVNTDFKVRRTGLVVRED